MRNPNTQGKKDEMMEYVLLDDNWHSSRLESRASRELKQQTGRLVRLPIMKVAQSQHPRSPELLEFLQDYRYPAQRREVRPIGWFKIEKKICFAEFAGCSAQWAGYLRSMIFIASTLYWFWQLGALSWWLGWGSAGFGWFQPNRLQPCSPIFAVGIFVYVLYSMLVYAVWHVWYYFCDDATGDRITVTSIKDGVETTSSPLRAYFPAALEQLIYDYYGLSASVRVNHLPSCIENALWWALIPTPFSFLLLLRVFNCERGEPVDAYCRCDFSGDPFQQTVTIAASSDKKIWKSMETETIPVALIRDVHLEYVSIKTAHERQLSCLVWPAVVLVDGSRLQIGAAEEFVLRASSAADPQSDLVDEFWRALPSSSSSRRASALRQFLFQDGGVPPIFLLEETWIGAHSSERKTCDKQRCRQRVRNFFVILSPLSALSAAVIGSELGEDFLWAYLTLPFQPFDVMDACVH
jgi:hypothetical protein